MKKNTSLVIGPFLLANFIGQILLLLPRPFQMTHFKLNDPTYIAYSFGSLHLAIFGILDIILLSRGNTWSTSISSHKFSFGIEWISKLNLQAAMNIANGIISLIHDACHDVLTRYPSHLPTSTSTTCFLQVKNRYPTFINHLKFLLRCPNLFQVSLLFMASFNFGHNLLRTELVNFNAFFFLFWIFLFIFLIAHFYAY